jgi:hypothetical protein
MYETYIFTELVTKVKPNINSVEVHPQLSNNNEHLVDGAGGCWFTVADYSYIVYLITSVIRITRVHRINDCCSLILITLITQLMTACVSLTFLHLIPQIKRPPLTHTLQNCTQLQALALIKVPSRDHVQWWCLVSIICDHRQKKDL